MASNRVSLVWWTLGSIIIFNKTYFLFFFATAGFLAASLVLVAGADLATVFNFDTTGFFAAVLILATGADLATVFDFTAAFFASAGFFAAVLVLAAGADLATVFDFTATFFASAGFFAAVLVLAAGADLATVCGFTADFFAAVLVLAVGDDLTTTVDFATLLSETAATSVILSSKAFAQKILRNAQPSIRKILSEIKIAGTVSILNPSPVSFVPINALTTADTSQHIIELELKELLFSSVFILIFLKFWLHSSSFRCS